MSNPTLATLLAATVVVGACSTTPPPRDDYTGPDNVGAVERSMLVGKWKGRILNPIEGESAGPFDVDFMADDTLVYTVPDTASGLGLVYEMSGTWQVLGQEVSTQVTDVRETTDSTLGRFTASLMNSFKDRIAGTADVREATPERVVLVSVEGQAQELRRVR